MRREHADGENHRVHGPFRKDNSRTVICIFTALSQRQGFFIIETYFIKLSLSEKPRNENLMAFWDTVADRLYKIRNSLNIEGVKRTLALFAPPIDPGMLGPQIYKIKL